MLACVRLYNFLRKECHSNEFPIELDNETLSSPPISVNQEENFEPFVETQEQQRNTANEWKNTIATKMWNDVEHVNENEH